MTLPGRAKELSRCLDRLVVNVTIGPGSKFGNASEAVEAIRRVIARLDRWYGESLGRPDGESDGDREELQSILDEAREVLRHINVGEQ